MIKVFGLILALFAWIALSSAPVLAGEMPKSFKKCKACHKLDKDNSKWTVGPGLKGIGKRVSTEYLEKMLKDPQGAFDDGGPEIDALKSGAKFKAKLKMPKAVKKLDDEKIKELVEYMQTL